MDRGKAAFTVREGSSNVAAYGPDERGRYTITWYRFAGDKRHREKKTGEKAARARAKEIARNLANGRADTIEINGARRETLVRIEAMANEIGVPLYDLVEQAVTAKKRLGGGSISDAIDSHMQVRTINGSRATIKLLVVEFMRRKRTAMVNGDRSEVHIKNLGEILEGGLNKKENTPRVSEFMKTFGERTIISITHDELQDWLNDRRDRKGKVVGPRRRRHIRAAIVALYNEARKNRHLPQGARHAAELTDNPKPIKGVEPTFTPEQFEILINGAHRDLSKCELVPALALGAFGRMRPSEVARLDWSAVTFFEKDKTGVHFPIAGEIDVSGKVAGKTGMARIIEITPQLAKMLRLYVRPNGPVLNPKITRIDNHLRRLAHRLGLKWLRNILRGSSTSYLYAATDDLNYVAAQHGTSTRELKREYLERKTKEQAANYHAIRLAERGNVLELRWGTK